MNATLRRSAEYKILEDCMFPIAKHGGGSVKVWGCFTFDGVGELTRAFGRIDKEVYKANDRVLLSGLRLLPTKPGTKRRRRRSNGMVTTGSRTLLGRA